MRYTIAIMIVLMFIVTGCDKVQDTGVNKSYGGAPKIMLNGDNYFASELHFLEELPEGFKYAGKLTEEEKQYAGIIGDEYYISKDSDTIEYIYVYQECGIRISESEVDSTKRQWAYVKWSKNN